MMATSSQSNSDGSGKKVPMSPSEFFAKIYGTDRKCADSSRSAEENISTAAGMQIGTQRSSTEMGQSSLAAVALQQQRVATTTNAWHLYPSWNAEQLFWASRNPGSFFDPLSLPPALTALSKLHYSFWELHLPSSNVHIVRSFYSEKRRTIISWHTRIGKKFQKQEQRIWHCVPAWNGRLVNVSGFFFYVKLFFFCFADKRSFPPGGQWCHYRERNLTNYWVNSRAIFLSRFNIFEWDCAMVRMSIVNFKDQFNCDLGNHREETQVEWGCIPIT